MPKAKKDMVRITVDYERPEYQKIRDLADANAQTLAGLHRLAMKQYIQRLEAERAGAKGTADAPATYKP